MTTDVAERREQGVLLPPSEDELEASRPNSRMRFFLVAGTVLFVAGVTVGVVVTSISVAATSTPREATFSADAHGGMADNIIEKDVDVATVLLKKQLKEVQEHHYEDGCSAGLKSNDNLFQWDVMVMGPPGTFYEGGFFHASLVFPKDYPQAPPKMKFLSNMFHPNISPDGDVSIGILTQPTGNRRPGGFWRHWRPDYSAAAILHAVLGMLSVPDTDTAVNAEAAWLFHYDKEEFKKKVGKTVRESQDAM